jgi:hypothetical protein
VDGDVTASGPGPLAEEAARLVEAIGDWARGAVGEHGPTADGRTAGIGGSPECQLCPVCQLLALARRAQPETFGHLAEASASLVAALRTLVERHDHATPHPTGVERIDLDGRDAFDDAGDPSDVAP